MHYGKCFEEYRSLIEALWKEKRIKHEVVAVDITYPDKEHGPKLQFFSSFGPCSCVSGNFK